MASLFDRYLQESDAFTKGESHELTKGQRCLKYTLVVVNVVFLIFSIVLMSLGTVAYNTNVGSLAGSSIPQGIIALGVFVLFLSLLGCVGAWRESRFALGCYFFFLMLLTLLLFAVGLGVYSERSQASNYIQEGWVLASNGVRVSLQNYYGCCGLSTNQSLAGFPCPPNNQTLPQCLSILTDAFYNNFTPMAGSAVAFAVLMFVSMVFVCFLIRGIKKKQVGATTSSDNPTPEATAPASST